MQHRSMRIRRRENTIELSRILFDRRATASRVDDNPQARQDLIRINDIEERLKIFETNKSKNFYD